MSTSPSPAPAHSTFAPQVPPYEPFLYDSVVPEKVSDDSYFRGVERQASPAGTSEIEIRALGREEGEAAARKEFEVRLAEERSRITAALTDFKRERIEYLKRVEAQVVQLALSIARKVLHREAQVDPLVLAAIVRVALDQIDRATSVTLRVHPQNASKWRLYLSTKLSTEELPTIVEDGSQTLDQCSLETAMGTTTIGLDLQLKEIEQGLMDLLLVRQGVER